MNRNLLTNKDKWKRSLVSGFNYSVIYMIVIMVFYLLLSGIDKKSILYAIFAGVFLSIFLFMGVFLGTRVTLSNNVRFHKLIYLILPIVFSLPSYIYIIRDQKTLFHPIAIAVLALVGYTYLFFTIIFGIIISNRIIKSSRAKK